MHGVLLLSVDLEDVRDHVADGRRYAERVPANTERYLRFFNDRGVRATFFVVGRVAERYPGLIREIVAEGHELACHTHEHVQLDRLTPDGLAADLSRNLEALARCGGEHVQGFRAPTFSMTERTRWAYPVLARLGFTYSTSVIPAPNPLYGWPAFGGRPRALDGVLELPLTLHPLLRIPLAGGVHFRTLPFFVVRQGVRRVFRRDQPVQTYFHPYDIDTGQERFMHPDLSGNRFYNALMYVGRGRVLPRLGRLLDSCHGRSYREYLAGAGAP